MGFSILESIASVVSSLFKAVGLEGDDTVPKAREGFGTAKPTEQKLSRNYLPPVLTRKDNYNHQKRRPHFGLGKRKRYTVPKRLSKPVESPPARLENRRPAWLKEPARLEKDTQMKWMKHVEPVVSEAATRLLANNRCEPRRYGRPLECPEGLKSFFRHGDSCYFIERFVDDNSL